jgi:hypothetical protein
MGDALKLFSHAGQDVLLSKYHIPLAHPCYDPQGAACGVFPDQHKRSSRNPGLQRTRRNTSVLRSDDLCRRRLRFALESSVDWGPEPRAEMRKRKGAYLELCGKEIPCSTVRWMPGEPFRLICRPMQARLATQASGTVCPAHRTAWWRILIGVEEPLGDGRE